MPDRPAYLLLLAYSVERRRFADYVAAMSPQLSRHGGRHLALAPAPAIEAYGHNDGPTSVMVSRWRNVDQLRAFWQSHEHQDLTALRSRFGAFVAVALESADSATSQPGTDAALAIFLGAGPSPALLEAEGARALTLVRERQIEPLEGCWTHGDVAIYGWASAEGARRQLVMFSSGQRGRAMLVPVLPPPPAPVPAAVLPPRTDAPLFAA